MIIKFHFTYGKLYHNVEKLDAVLVRTAYLLSAVDLLHYFTWRFLIFASFNELLIIIVCWLLRNLLYLFDNFVYFRYNLNETKKDETWVVNYLPCIAFEIAYNWPTMKRQNIWYYRRPMWGYIFWKKEKIFLWMFQKMWYIFVWREWSV